MFLVLTAARRHSHSAGQMDRVELSSSCMPGPRGLVHHDVGVNRESDRRWRLFDDHTRYVDRFGLLLIVTAIAVVTLSLVDLREGESSVRAEVGQILVSAFVGGTLLLALRASGVGRRFRILADILIGAGILLTVVLVVVAELTDTNLVRSDNPSYAWDLLALLAPLVVVRRLIHHQRASVQTLLGAVSAYLLFALAFSFLFLTIETVSGEAFFGSVQPTTAYMYFSLTSITTLGYGDLAAVTPLGRLLATTEAVIGQVYLVTFVAMIVGLIVEQRQREHRDEPD